MPHLQKLFVVFLHTTTIQGLIFINQIRFICCVYIGRDILFIVYRKAKTCTMDLNDVISKKDIIFFRSNQERLICSVNAMLGLNIELYFRLLKLLPVQPCSEIGLHSKMVITTMVLYRKKIAVATTGLTLLGNIFFSNSLNFPRF